MLNNIGYVMVVDYIVGYFYDDVRVVMELVFIKGFVFIVVGGIGMYLWWYVIGIFFVDLKFEGFYLIILLFD